MTDAAADAPVPGGFNEYGRLRRVALRRPADAFVDRARIKAQWRRLNYHAAPDLAAAKREFDTLVELLESLDVAIDFLPGYADLSLDSLYVHDATVVAPDGLILCNMGKPARTREPAVNGHHLEELGWTIAGEIAGAGRLEGGDLVWLDAKTVAVGRGYRSNDAGFRQLKHLLGPEIEIKVCDLPHYKGPDDVFHLMSILSPLDHDLALVYSPLMTVAFRDWLRHRGLELIEVPDAEFATMATNALALGPRHALVLDGNPETRRRLAAAGVQVEVIQGAEISAKGEGGPTCLTRPLIRE